MNQNAQMIYNLLLAAGVTRAGALGLLGNWMAESGLEANRLQGDFNEGRTLSRAYTGDVMAGRISRSQFARDAKGYGLAQWTYYTRKEDLYDFWQSSGTALDDVGMQVKFALHELSSEAEYSGVWATLRTTEDIWTAVDKICRLYERPYYNNIDVRYRYAKELEAELSNNEDNSADSPGSLFEGAVAAATEGVSPATETLWPPRTLCNGMSGDDTAVLQAVLAARGYPVHYVDGAFGAYLEDIVKDFQKAVFPDEPAEWDGIVGQKTWGALLRQS